jgi:hypothetical protein
MMTDSLKLRKLADWFDLKYPDDLQSEVQADLRKIADKLESAESISPDWKKEKPDIACVFACRTKIKDRYDYDLFTFDWERGEAPENVIEDDTTSYYYLAWLDQDGDELGDKEDLLAEEYLILEVLPTLEQHKEK